jgi:hypothetical protein
LLLFAPLLLLQQPPIQQLDALAKARDVAGLTRFLASVPQRNPFSVIKTGGAYAAGQRGWSAKDLKTPDGQSYVVFSTPLIQEDMGELLFRVTPAGRLDYVPESNSLGVQLDRHSFDVRFDLDAGKLIATDTMDCHWTASRGRHFFFRISPTFTIRSIVNATNQAVPFSQAGGLVAVAPRDEALKLKVKYDGTVLMPAFDRQISSKEATLSAAMWYPTIARQPAPYDITFHIKKDWTALGQGNLVSDAIGAGGERVMKFRNDVPVIWYGASAGPYKTVMQSINGREYATMSSSMTREDMLTQNVVNSEIVEFYSNNFMPYPFKRWTALDSWQFHGGPGALEAYSFATYPGGLPGIDAHEPSHCWWGGLLNNDYLRSLWNESFAVFCEGLYMRNRPGGNGDELKLAYVSEPFAFPGYDVAPLSDSGDPIGPAAAALGYGKGGFVLQMLEDELGTEAMIRTMREWVRSNPPRHIGSWQDYEKVVNKVTGGDYSWFFNQWVHRAGYPTFSLSDVTWANGMLSGKITFQDKPYRVHADLLMEFADGARQFARIDTMQQPDRGGYKFTTKCPSRPVMIAIDPWHKILRGRTPEETGLSLETIGARCKLYVDPKRADTLKPLRFGSALKELPADLSNVAIFGSPHDIPAMASLCEQVGFEVAEDTLVYKKTRIDLNKGGAVAVVDLPNGQHCIIGLGKCVLRPNLGRARLLVFDEYGRPIRAETEPVTTGPLSFRFPS